MLQSTNVWAVLHISPSLVMSLAHSYSHTPHYFYFSITFSTSLIHHWAPHHCNLTCEPLCLLVHNTHLCSIRLASLSWWTHDVWFTCFTFPLLVTMCALLQPDQSQIIVPCGQALYYSFASDEPCVCFLVYHLYITCLFHPSVRCAVLLTHHRNDYSVSYIAESVKT